MDGTGVVGIVIGAPTAATALRLGSLGNGSRAIELLCWVGWSLALAGAAFLVAKWWRAHGGRALWHSLPVQRWPDFKRWDDRAEFELHEAAALWFDAEPRLPMWWRARLKFRRWQPMIAGGAIPAEPAPIAEIAPRTISSITPHTRVHRATLRALAEKEGSWPLFLFPERRVWPCPRQDRAW